jgi:hypothetical protein
MLAPLIAESVRKPPMIMSLNDFRSGRGSARQIGRFGQAGRFNER